MAYQSWSVVFGEQPSAAKWNILGTNDASFNDGTGIGTGVINSTSLKEAFFRGKHQADTVNSTPTGLTAQFGWGFVQGTGAATLSETVTFPSAFASVPLMVLTTYHSALGSLPNSIDDFTIDPATAVSVTANDIATTGFASRLVTASSTFSVGTYYGYSWMAIGTV